MAGDNDNVGWQLNSRGVSLLAGFDNTSRVFLTHKTFSLILKDWLERFPEENPNEKLRVDLLRANATLDQDLAAFRDTLKSYLRKVIDDPELLTLAAKIIHKMKLE